MDYLTKWPEVYAIPNKQASIVVDALMTNFFCRLRVPRELHSDQGQNFKSQLMQEVFDCQGISKTQATLCTHRQMACYMKTIEDQLRKVILMHQRDWDERLPIFLLAKRASTHENTGSAPDSMFFRRELHLPCDLLFGASHQHGAVYDQLRGVPHRSATCHP
jgi:hypothetical protein